MNFGQAIMHMKGGQRVSRAGWNGKGMFVYLERYLVHADLPKERPMEPCFVMFTADGRWQPGWLASQADMLAEDWGLVERVA